MRRHWERFAREDPMFYITGWRKDWTFEDFFQSGRELADLIVEWLGEETPTGRLLDIGCGLGRISVAFADHCERVDAIDISESMIEQAKQLDPPPNVHFAVSSGSDLAAFEDAVFDMVFCYVVFQHIPDDGIVGAYLSEIRRVLKPSAIAVVQFDTRPIGSLGRAYYTLPDALMPPTRRRFMRRYRRSRELVASLIDAAGLVIEREHGPRSDNNVLLLRKPVA